MQRIVTLIASVAVPAALVALWPQPAAAQFDHLRCHPIKDAKIKYTADLTVTPEQIPPFIQYQNCELKGPARALCVPVNKQVGQTDAPGSDGYPTLGVELTNDYLCYQIKCKASDKELKELNPTIDVADQFAHREVTSPRGGRLCVPAVKTCEGAGAPMCNGVCPNNDPCVDMGGTCGCV